MISRDLLKRTPVRLAGAFTLLFALTVVALVAVLYLTLGAELESHIRKRVEETSDTLLAIDAEHGFDALAVVVADEAKSVRDFDSIFLLRREDGAFQAGNVQNVKVFAGWDILDRAWLPMVASKGDPDDRFYAIWKPVSNGYLLVGQSDREIREVQRILLHGLSWGLLTTVLLAIGSATYLARRAQQKIDVFATTLSKVSHGDIANRVPLTGSGDDLDKVAGQINATLAHLQKLIESVNQASSDIAHDLKKPIGRLRRRLEEALSAKGDPKEFRGRVEESLEELRFHRRDVRGVAAHHAARGGSTQGPLLRCRSRLRSRGGRRHLRARRRGSGRQPRERGADEPEGADPGRPRAADAAFCQPYRERHPPLAEGYPHRGEPLEPGREVRGGRVGHRPRHPDR